MPQTFSDVPCVGCPCLCDDLQIEVDGGKVVKLEGGCPKCRDLLASPSPAPACRTGGVDAPLEFAVSHAARILAAARSTLVYGLSGASCEAARLAVSLAKKLGAVLHVPEAASALGAFQSLGEVSCTLGEIRGRADLIVTIGCDPATTHPRLLERTRTDVTVVAIDDHQTATMAHATERIDVSADGWEYLLTTWLALAAGVSVDDAEVERRAGAPASTWSALSERIGAAKYTVILHGTWPSLRVADLLARWVRKLNDRSRVSALRLSQGLSSLGAENVVTWLTGLPPPVDFAQPNARLLDATRVERMIAREQFEAALVIGADRLPAGLNATNTPIVAIDWRSTEATAAARVALPIARPGVESGGTMFRFDGVPLKLRPFLLSSHPSDCEVLGQLLSAIGA